MPTVELVNITKRFGKVTAVKDFNLKVDEGEYVTILGPSGCGKTTIVKMVAGIFEPSEGGVLIDGKRVNGVPTHERDIGYVFQNIALFPHMSVGDNVAFGPRARGWSKARIEEVEGRMLRMVRMEERARSFPRELSGGAQQKTSLGRALASGAKLLLLDEPLSALDASVRIELRRDLRGLVKDMGLTAIHVTHDQEEAMSISDRIVLMRAGEVIEMDRPEKLYHEPREVFTANFIGEMNFIECTVKRKRDGLVDVTTRSNENLRVPDGGFAVGDPIVVAIRPENVVLGASRDENALAATVTAVEYMGSYLRCRARMMSGESLVLDIPMNQNDKINNGEVVMLGFRTDRILTYRRPEAGLAEALKLE